MDKEQCINKIQAVIGTLNGTTIRADQLDAVQRIAVCTRELKSIIETLKTLHEEKGE